MVKASCALVSARLALSQTLDDRESAFSFPLSATRCLFGCGVISSFEVTGEAVLVTSRTKVTGVTKVPFSMTRTTLFPRLERCSFFLAPHLGIHLLVYTYVLFLQKNYTYLLFFKGKEGVWSLAENLLLVNAYAYCITRKFQLTIHRTQYSSFFFILHLFFTYIVTIIFENL